LKLTVPPTQTGLVLVGDVVGVGFIVTIVVLVAEQPVLPTLAVTVYVPVIANVTPANVGEEFVEVKPPGPFHK
jgi:hypothetical protein